MKKKFTAFVAGLITFICIFSFSACRNGQNNEPNGGDNGNEEPGEEIDGLTLLEGTWRFQDIIPEYTGETSSPVVDFDFSSYTLVISADGSFTFTGWDGAEEFYCRGTATNGETLYYYNFSGMMGETEVTSSAYLRSSFYPDQETLNFGSIVFSDDRSNGYSSCICVREII